MIGNFLAVTQEELDQLYSSPNKLPAFLYEEKQNEILDVDKSWHAIHYTLTGTAYGGDTPLANVVFGITPIGEEDVGYGPALGTDSDAVKAIANALNEITETQFKEKFDAYALATTEIYPQIWDEGDEALDYVATYFNELREFYREAAEKDLAIITFIN
jgi:hypothetical protein